MSDRRERRDGPSEGETGRRPGRAIGLLALLAGVALVVWLDERRREAPRWLGPDGG